MIPSATFAGADSGADRHFSIDPYANRLYYAVTDGSVQVIDIATATQVGSHPSNSFLGAIIGGYRHIIYDPNSGLIWYSVTDGSVASVDPVAGTARPTLVGVHFTDVTGAGRIITMTYEVLPEPAAVGHPTHFGDRDVQPVRLRLRPLRLLTASASR